jgi:hypothetical protein
LHLFLLDAHLTPPIIRLLFQLLLRSFVPIVQLMFLQSVPNGAKMKRSNQQHQKNLLRRVESDMILARGGDGVDPRLLELVRLLARRAAREVYDEQMKGRRVTRS